jgi:dienelactone hydrolase
MKQLFALIAFTLCLVPFTPAIAGETMIYHDGDVELEGYWQASSCSAAQHYPAPTILVIHQWMGLTENEKMRVEMLSQNCFNAFAIDMYGKDIRPANTDEAGKQATIYKSDSALARKRVTAALDFVKTLPNVEANKIAVIGYCFGGTMALELARSGADIKGAVSFHGALATPVPVEKAGIIKASIQVHHGADDPLVPPPEVDGFVKEMNAANADWIMTHYAHAVHAFTQKEAGSDPSKGIAYNEKADKRSWQATLDFFKEVFG